MFENVKRAFTRLENALTLKSDYSEELEELAGFEGDLKVLRHLGTPVWKITDLRAEINRVREWIKQEMDAKRSVI
jgi:hypothetical protein